MPTNRETLLCSYHYDPLDRLAACTLSKQASNQRFYLKSRLATEIQDQVHRSIFQHEDQLLAQQQRLSSTAETTLLATDQQRSVLNALDAARPHPLAYTPYGHRPPENGLLSLLGFNGEQPDPVTGHYLLGNGYRAFNPVLMRFNSPDNMSPFGKGGLNSYAYALGDPRNGIDPTGHWTFRGIWGSLKGVFGFGKSSSATGISQKLQTTLPANKDSVSTLPASSLQETRPASSFSQHNVAAPQQVETTTTHVQTNSRKTGSQPSSGLPSGPLPEDQRTRIKHEIDKRIGLMRKIEKENEGRNHAWKREDEYNAAVSESNALRNQLVEINRNTRKTT